jgi:hypothetical protein
LTNTVTPDLAARQRELIAALVAGGPVPTGVDRARFDAAERALRDKRAGEVAQAWPLLAAALDASALDASALDASALDASALNDAALNDAALSTSDASDPGETFRTLFTGWARARPPRGALRDGWDFARELAAVSRLPEPAERELAARDVRSRYDGRRDPRPRRVPAVRWVSTGWLVGLPRFGACLLHRPTGVLRRHTG